MVVAQLVRALDCGSRCRRFESGLPPKKPFFLKSFYKETPNPILATRIPSSAIPGILGNSSVCSSL